MAVPYCKIQVAGEKRSHSAIPLHQAYVVQTSSQRERERERETLLMFRQRKEKTKNCLHT